MTIIDFFELDTRQDLLLGRCVAIVLLHDWLEEARVDPQLRAEAEACIDELLADQATFAGCLRGYRDLYRRDREEALQWRQRARRYAASKEPELLAVLP